MRQQAVDADISKQQASRFTKLLGGLIVLLGLLASATGHLWFEPVSNVVSGPLWSQEITLWLPFWPFEQFMSLLIIGFVTMLFTSSRTKQGITATAT